MPYTIENFRNGVTKNLYQNGIAYSQLKQIFTIGSKVKFNSEAFKKICFRENFNTQWFGTRLIIFLSLYHKVFDLDIVSFLNKSEKCELPDKALELFNNYNRHCYFCGQNNDRIDLPEEVYNVFMRKFMPTTEMNEDYTYTGKCQNTINLLKYMELSTNYMIYEMLKTGTITAYHCNGANLDFNKQYFIMDDEE